MAIKKKKKVKTKLSILAILISSIGYFSFINSELIKIQLIEAKTNLPIRCQEIEVYYYQMIYDAPPKLELIKIISTDEEGNFELPRKIFGNKEVGIKCGDDFKMMTMAIRNNQIWFFRYRNGFTQVLSKTRYDLGSMVETNFIYYKDTINTEFDRIKLIAYDNIGYWEKLKERIIENQSKFENDQEMLWNYLWAEFQKSVNGETTPPFNSNAWFKHVITCKRLFDLDLRTAFNEAKKISESDKLYYHLYSLCLIINGQGGISDKSEREIVDWVEKEVKKFYEGHSDLDLYVKNENLPMDALSLAYKAMK